MSEDTRPEAKPTSPHDGPGSLAAAAAAFRSLPSLAGTPKGPGENPPKSKAAQGTAPDSQPEVEETEDEETPEAEETTEAADTDVEETTEETTDEVESEVEQTEDAEEEETEPTTPKSRRLKFSDGTEADVSEDEAYNGYLRTKDYTHKTQAAAEARRKAEAAEQSWSERAAEYAANLAQVKAAMDRFVVKEPNWPELRKKLTPEEFADAVADYQAYKSERDRVEAEEQKVAKERAEKFAEDYSKWRKSEVDALMSAIPEWVDPKVGAADAQAMAQYALANGFSKEEVDNAVDHRYLLLIRKAMLWDRAQKNAGKVKPKVVAKPTKTAPPGGKKPAPKPVSDEKRAQDNLRNQGSLEAAASVFSHVIRRAPRK
jgi:hypothetical protein